MIVSGCAYEYDEAADECKAEESQHDLEHSGEGSLLARCDVLQQVRGATNKRVPTCTSGNDMYKESAFAPEKR